MFNSGILDVAVGLIFVYLLLSLVSSAVNEIIEGWLKKRAVDLERGIRELLQGDQTLVQKLYEHPLIYSLFEGDYDATQATSRKTKVWAATGANLPSYIPSRNFALALMDLLLPPEDGGQSGAACAMAPGAALAAGGAGGAGTLQPLRDAVNGLSNQNLRRALLPLIDAAGDDASKARANIEGGFDSAMDRVSGWYKRRVQWFILAIGLVIAVATNADTITITNSLSRDVSLRNAVVGVAEEYAKAIPSVTVVPASEADRKLVCRDDQDTSPQCTACKKDMNSPECRVARNLAQMNQLGLPVGWDRSDPRRVPRDPGGWLTKLLGWIVTAAAVSLGAPFWFDLLNKVMVIRSTVKPREKSPEEPPVDAGNK